MLLVEQIGGTDVSGITTELAIAAVVLAGISLVLFVLAIRRLLARQAEVTVTMLRRYDDRLADFAQTLADALSALQAPQPSATPHLEEDPEPMVRTLELARERTRADGAIALVTSGSGAPIVATVGLSESETNHIARMGFPDYRGARAIEVAFAGDLPAPEGSQPVRAGLVLPLLDESDAQSLLGVLTREKGRHFSEEDVDALDAVVRVARSPVSRALRLREPDVVPEIDVLTNLLDRQSFDAVLEREIVRARLAGHPLSLLVLDVDRLTSLNARLGIPGVDSVLRELATRLQSAMHHLDYTIRLGGGRFAVLRPGSEAAQARELYDAVRDDLSSAPLVGGEPDAVSLSAGVAELVPRDDAASFVARADHALQQAKQGGRGTIVVEPPPDPSRTTLVLHATAGDRLRRG
jgi:diguanylate cyclase (GGDEF)-like protein